MNYRSIDLAFSFTDWVQDDDRDIWDRLPPKIAKWANTYVPNNHLYRGLESGEEESVLVLTLDNVPRSFVTFALMSAPGIKILDETEYAPIHPGALPLFNFGDTE
jgi:hypothetical protein